jgi:hypothetical protein
MTVNAGADRVRPELQVRSATVVFFRDDLADRVSQDSGLLREGRNPLLEAGVHGGSLNYFCRELLDLIVEAPPRNGLWLAQVPQTTRFVTQ